MNIMKLPKEIENRKQKLIGLCDKYKVKRIYFFGSVVNGNFDPQKSDIDLLVEMEDLPPVEKGELLMNFWSDLENLFKRNVDIVTARNIKNPFLKKEIDKSKLLIYDRAS